MTAAATAKIAVIQIGMAALLIGCTPPPSTTVQPVPSIVPPPPPTPPATMQAAVNPQAAAGGDPQSVERRAADAAKAIAEIMAVHNQPIADQAADTTSQPDASPSEPAAPPIPTELPHLPVAPPPVAPIAPPPIDDSAKPSIANTAVSVAPPDAAPRAVVPLPPKSHANDFEQQVADRAAQNPRDVAAQLDQQLLQLIQGQPVPSSEKLAGLASDDRQMLTTLIDGVANFRLGVAADGNMLMTRKIRPLIDMADRMKSESDLMLPTAALCTSVAGFGSYIPIEPARFPAMTPVSVVVYCEVSNFLSKVDEKNLYTTRLHQDLVLYTESGLPVWNDKGVSKLPVTDICRNRRHDFFLATKILLPPTLSTGRHVLKVTVIDLNANHVAETSIPISIIAK